MNMQQRLVFAVEGESACFNNAHASSPFSMAFWYKSQKNEDRCQYNSQRNRMGRCYSRTTNDLNDCSAK